MADSEVVSRFIMLAKVGPQFWDASDYKFLRENYTPIYNLELPEPQSTARHQACARYTHLLTKAERAALQKAPDWFDTL